MAKKFKTTKNLGMLLLSIWLIITGLQQLITLPIPAIIMGLLAIAAGGLLLLNR